MPARLLFFTAVVALTADVNAFLRQQPMDRRILRKSDVVTLDAAFDPYEDSCGGGGDALDRNRARTDLRNFLTQRSIQSFVYLLNQCHDGHTVGWLEKTLDFPKIDSFHGTGAFNMTLFPEWDSLFLDMANRETEQVVVEVQQKTRSHRGWSHQSNYLNAMSAGAPSQQPEETTPVESKPRRRGFGTGNYLENLNQAVSSEISNKKVEAPDSMAELPTAARNFPGNYLENIGAALKSKFANRRQRKKRTGRKTRREREEFKLAKKLKLLGNSASEMKPGRRVNYLETLTSNTITTPESIEPDKTYQLQEQQAEETVEYVFDIDPPSLVMRIMSVREQISKEWKEDLTTLVRTNEQILEQYEEKERQDMLALEDEDDEDVEDNESDEKARMLDEMEAQSYDRNAMAYLTSSIAGQDRASSPFRRSNFDLLLLLCTQESVHRVLREYKEDSDDEFHMERYNLLHQFYKDQVAEFFDGHTQSFGRADKFLEGILKMSPIGRQRQDGGFCLIEPAAIVEDVLRARSIVAREWKSIVATIPDEHLNLRRILFARQLMEATDWKLDGIGDQAIYFDESSQGDKIYINGTFE